MGRRILIIEDDPDTTDLLKDCLEVLGCSVDSEPDPTRAIARLREGEYSGIVLDIMSPGSRWVKVFHQLRHSGSKIPLIAISENAIEEEVMSEGAHAFLAKPFEGRAFKRVVQRVIPPTREELIRDYSGGESTITQNAYVLAKRGDFRRARKAIELLDNNALPYIMLLSYHVQAGDLEGAKATVHGAPSLRLGGHWVRCMTNALVEAGDVRGALAIADNLTSAEERDFAKGMIVAQQAAVGDLSGAKATLLLLSPSMNGHYQAISAIAYALVTTGNFEEALSLVCQMEEGETRVHAIGNILYAQRQTGDISGAERTAASINNEELRRQAFVILERINHGNYQQTYTLMVHGRAFVADKFSNTYPVD
jgi:CheY-like chemotaxis protein